MNIAVFGATGKTGLEIVKQSLTKGDAITAFVRDPSKLELVHDNLKVIQGDIFEVASVSQAIQGQDAVVCALGSSELKKTTVRSEGTKNIIQGMKENKVKRLVIISAMGVGESWDTLSGINKFFFATLLKSSREDHEAQEAAVKESGLDWTIIRPSGLVDTPRTGIYDAGENIPAKTSKIARADVADLILKELDQKTNIGKALTISN